MPIGEDSPVRVLVVEDEVKMSSLIRRGLVDEGYAADVALDLATFGRPAPVAQWAAVRSSRS